MERDEDRGTGGEGVENVRGGAEGNDVEGGNLVSREESVQHARRGQAESPRERTLNQPEKKKEGH